MDQECGWADQNGGLLGKSAHDGAEVAGRYLMAEEKRLMTKQMPKGKEQGHQPRGIMPQFLWRETRIADLREALQRYRDYDHGDRQKPATTLMREWEAEIAEHQAWLLARNPAREPSPSRSEA